MTEQAGPPEDAWDIARDWAFHWATTATSRNAEAEHHRAKALGYTGKPALANVYAQHREQADTYAQREAEAIRLADMWAKVASIYEPRPDPSLANASYRAQAEAQAALTRAMRTEGETGTGEDHQGDTPRG